MNRQQIVDRIRKLRAMGATSNPHEADTARSIAEKWQTEYSITEDELKVEDAREKLFAGDAWKLWLAKGIARLRSTDTAECSARPVDVNIMQFEGHEYIQAMQDFGWYEPRVQQRLTGLQYRDPKWKLEYTKGIVSGVLRRYRSVVGIRSSTDLAKMNDLPRSKGMPGGKSRVGKLSEEHQRSPMDHALEAGGITTQSAFIQGLRVGVMVEVPGWLEDSWGFDETFGWEDM